MLEGVILLDANKIIARAKYLFFNKISDLNKNIRLRAGRRRRHEKLETLVFYLFDHPNNFFITTTRNNWIASG